MKHPHALCCSCIRTSAQYEAAVSCSLRSSQTIDTIITEWFHPAAARCAAPLVCQQCVRTAAEGGVLMARHARTPSTSPSGSSPEHAAWHLLLYVFPVSGLHTGSYTAVQVHGKRPTGSGWLTCPAPHATPQPAMLCCAVLHCATQPVLMTNIAHCLCRLRGLVTAKLGKRNNSQKRTQSHASDPERCEMNAFSAGVSALCAHLVGALGC